MDPLSVTTAVTGFVSLGIQVVGGLVTYLDAIKDREDDLRAANDRVQQLHRQIKTVNTVTEQIGVQHLGASDDVKHCIVSCEKQLKELEDFLVEIGGGQQVTQTTPVPRSSRLKDAIEQIKKKGSYPFRRSKIKMLRTRLDNTVDALQTALITLDL
ncbi:hypothetical protein NKR23_g7786 [Pleurostoma richardsiae]|uniref:Fungal N-terminal domain-containing protein n=1 Tax=Pleurostoma richardsiae TaxID=41990 RepID=A0AA38RKS7_9PEZI|nr:hypothetical protein NKR23_g7786 [Pleurostoma richardsiae]